jgi:Delta14-sterol reductase
MEQIAGFLAPVLIYALIFILAILLPGRWVTGYVTQTNSSQKLRYRLNGLPVFFIMVAIWCAVGYENILPWDWLYLHRWQSFTGAAIFGLIFSLAIVMPNAPVKKSFLADLYLGRLENPQLWNGRIDAKMWLYLAGATMLELNALSFSAHHYLLYGLQGSTDIFACTGLLGFFLVDYLTFEEVHLYTYDFFAERVGFKLGWGCIAFYPFFYAIPLWATVSLPGANSSPGWLVFSAIVFFTGWGLSRGANLQKYHFKKDPNRAFLGIIPETITDDTNALLVNGFWGLTRHINYLGEILMATGLVLSTGYPQLVWPWLYPLYYVVLLFPRQADDDKRCTLKYGALWAAYKKKVPRKIIPYIY